MTRSSWVRYGFAAAAVALALLAGWRATSRSGGITPAAERRAMPALSMTQLDGSVWRMGDHRGQVVLVNYWATWCGPCWEETPGLIRLSRELGPRGLAVVGVSVDAGGRDGAQAKVRKFVEEFKVPYPVAFPAAMSQLEWGLEGVPTTILVDREGRVAKSYLGAVREADFRRDVEALLAEKAVAAAGS